jgi:hypothetical protein
MLSEKTALGALAISEVDTRNENMRWKRRLGHRKKRGDLVCDHRSCDALNGEVRCRREDVRRAEYLLDLFPRQGRGYLVVDVDGHEQ